MKENFYLSEVTNEQLEDGMFRGLMDSLDDPYSEYYTAEELNELTEQTQAFTLASVLCQHGFRDQSAQDQRRDRRSTGS